MKGLNLSLHCWWSREFHCFSNGRAKALKNANSSNSDSSRTSRKWQMPLFQVYRDRVRQSSSQFCGCETSRQNAPERSTWHSQALLHNGLKGLHEGFRSVHQNNLWQQWMRIRSARSAAYLRDATSIGVMSCHASNVLTSFWRTGRLLRRDLRNQLQDAAGIRVIRMHHGLHLKTDPVTSCQFHTPGNLTRKFAMLLEASTTKRVPGNTSATKILTGL